MHNFLKSFFLTADPCLNCTCAETNQIESILIAHWLRDMLSAMSRAGRNFLLITKVWSRKKNKYLNKKSSYVRLTGKPARRILTVSNIPEYLSWLRTTFGLKDWGSWRKNWYTVNAVFSLNVSTTTRNVKHWYYLNQYETRHKISFPYSRN